MSKAELMSELATKPEVEGTIEPSFSGNGDFADDPEAVRLHLFSRLRLVWSKRRLLLRVAVVSLLISTLVAFLIPKRYESTAQLMPPDSQSSTSLALLAGMSAPGGLGMLATDLLGIKSTGALFVGVLRSRTVEDRLVDRFNLKKVYGQSLQMKAREKLADRTAITEDRKSGIIAITVTDNDPKRATAMANAYVEELNTTIAEQSTSSARRERVFLEDRLNTVRQDLENAEKDFSQFASSKGAIDIPAQGKAMVEAAASLEGQLIAAQSELDGLKQIYTEQNVRVRSTQARIDGLRAELRKLGGSAGNNSADDPPGDATYPTLRQLPILGVPFADKFRRMKVEEAVFEALTKQYELAKVQEAKEIPSVKVLDIPIIPEHKSFPPRLLIMILGTVCGIGVGIIWVLGQALWQETPVQDPGKLFVQEVFDTFAARVPWISRNGSSRKEAPLAAESSSESRPESKSARAGN